MSGILVTANTKSKSKLQLLNLNLSLQTLVVKYIRMIWNQWTFMEMISMMIIRLHPIVCLVEMDLMILKTNLPSSKIIISWTKMKDLVVAIMMFLDNLRSPKSFYKKVRKKLQTFWMMKTMIGMLKNHRMNMTIEMLIRFKIIKQLLQPRRTWRLKSMRMLTMIYKMKSHSNI